MIFLNFTGSLHINVCTERNLMSHLRTARRVQRSDHYFTIRLWIIIGIETRTYQKYLKVNKF